MKKLAIGCGVIVLLFGIVVVGVGYYGYMKVRSTVAQVAELGKIPDIERGIRIKTAYSVPVSRELTASQVERFMTVQARVRERLGRDAAAFERNYKTLAEKKEATIADLPALMSAYRDMASAWLNAKREQVQALNDAGLSLEEYRWIRGAAYQAIGAPLVDLDFARIAAEVKSGAQSSADAFKGAFDGPAPAANLKLIERHRTQLERNLALASFGL